MIMNIQMSYVICNIVVLEINNKINNNMSKNIKIILKNKINNK